MTQKNKLTILIPYSERLESEDIYKRYTEITISAIMERQQGRRKALSMLGLVRHIDFKLLEQPLLVRSEGPELAVLDLDHATEVVPLNKDGIPQRSCLSRAAIAVGATLFGR